MKKWDKGYMCGFATAVHILYGNGYQETLAKMVLDESNLPFKDFVEADIDNTDMETIQKLIGNES